MTGSEPIEIVPVLQAGRFVRKMRCPSCSRVLPVDTTTECDDCGAWLNVRVKVTVPGVERGETRTSGGEIE